MRFASTSAPAQIGSSGFAAKIFAGGPFSWKRSKVSVMPSSFAAAFRFWRRKARRSFARYRPRAASFGMSARRWSLLRPKRPSPGPIVMSRCIIWRKDFRAAGDPAAATPYLRAEESGKLQWKSLLGGGGFKIGLCWQGAPANPGRSFPVSFFRCFSALPGLRLISLQRGAAVQQLAELPSICRWRHWGISSTPDPMPFRIPGRSWKVSIW
jgi:hypothetical protein